MNDETLRADGHLGERLADLLDGRLSADDGARASQHLDVCPACALAFERARVAREAVASLPAAPFPEGLAERIAAALDAEEEPRRAGRRVVPFSARAGRTLLAAAALLVAGLAALLVLARHPVQVSEAEDAFGRIASGTEAMEIVGPSASELEGHFASRGLGFSTRVLDLAMMGWEVGGGRVGSIDGKRSALWTYRDAAGRLLVCQMYAGLASDARRGAEELRRGEMTFYVHRLGGRTLVFWQEGEVACVLASDIAAQEVVDLAVAKAMLPPRTPPRT